MLCRATKFARKRTVPSGPPELKGWPILREMKATWEGRWPYRNPRRLGVIDFLRSVAVVWI
eukprot:1393823-Amorphochlora_amoeboformis.AAC.3